MRSKEMIKAMKKHNFAEDVICEFESIMQPENEHGDKENLFVEAMDKLLTEEQRLLLWEYGGSCTGGGKSAKAYKQKLTGMTLSEKIEVLSQDKYYGCHFNEDGTIKAYMGCHCMQHRAKGTKPEKIPSAYGCAAGAAFQNLRDALDLKGKARIKSINYPKEGDGKDYISFTFEINE